MRHIDNPDLLNWVLRIGGWLHPDLCDVLRPQLDAGPKLASGLKQIWQILASDVPILRGKALWSRFHLHSQLRAGEWNTVLRLELLDGITPVLAMEPTTLPEFFPDLRWTKQKWCITQTPR